MLHAPSMPPPSPHNTPPPCHYQVNLITLKRIIFRESYGAPTFDSFNEEAQQCASPARLTTVCQCEPLT